jgi:hypothetical protein
VEQVLQDHVPESSWSKGISCMSWTASRCAILFHETGRTVVGYEIDATTSHVPMRHRFERGAARQYGGTGSTTPAATSATLQLLQPAARRPRGAELVPQQVRDHRRVMRSWYRSCTTSTSSAARRDLLGAEPGNQWMLPGREAPRAALALRPRDD